MRTSRSRCERRLLFFARERATGLAASFGWSRAWVAFIFVHLVWALSSSSVSATGEDSAFAPPDSSVTSSGMPSEAAGVVGAADGVAGVGDDGDAAAALTGFLDPFDYDPRGRRDPFAQPVADKPMTQGTLHGPLLPLQKFDVSQLRLVGIIWDVRRPKAMIKDPEGKTYIVGPNTKVGSRNGYIAVIREGEMVVVETLEQEGRLLSTTQVVKIAK